jgi:hypothetical protein
VLDLTVDDEIALQDSNRLVLRLLPLPAAPAEYAHALERLHAGMRQIDVTTPHFTDRVAELKN